MNMKERKKCQCDGLVSRQVPSVAGALSLCTVQPQTGTDVICWDKLVPVTDCPQLLRKKV